MSTKQQRGDFRRSMKYYEPVSRFMDGGSLYGRSRFYPRTAGRICRIFRTCIRLNFASDYFWTHTNANARAYNRQTLYPLFAYQLRPQGAPYPSPPGKALPDEVEIEMVWQQAA